MIADPGSLPFQAAAVTGQAVDRIMRRLRSRRRDRRTLAEREADENFIAVLAALRAERDSD